MNKERIQAVAKIIATCLTRGQKEELQEIIDTTPDAFLDALDEELQ